MFVFMSNAFDMVGFRKFILIVISIIFIYVKLNLLS